MLLASLREQRATISQAISVRDEPSWMNWGPSATSGVAVDETAALGFIPFVACIKAISEPLGMLPLKVFEKTAGGRLEATDHRVHYLVHDEPNPMMTASVFREWLVQSAVAAGNGVAWIERDKANRPVGLWPLRADRTRIDKKNGRLWYYTHTEEGPEEKNEDWEVLHVPGMGYDGTRGYRPVELMREALGLGIAAERFGSSLFGRGAHTSGALQSPKQLSKSAADRLVKQIEERIGGPHNSHRPLVLEEGLTWNPVSINPDEAQFLETRNFQAVEVARFMRVPASEIDAAGKDGMTYSNVEQDAMRLVTRTLMKWAVAVEKEMNRKLFSDNQIGRFYVEHQFGALLRGDTKSRNESHAIAGGRRPWKTVNEIRRDENMNDIEGGDELPAASLPNPDAMVPMKDESGADAKKKANARIVESFRAMFQDVAERILRREEKALRAAWPKIEKDGMAGFESWASVFYHGHESYASRAFSPAITALAGCLGAEVAVDTLAGAAARAHCRASKDILAERIGDTEESVPIGPDREVWYIRKVGIADGEVLRVLRAVEATQNREAV